MYAIICTVNFGLSFVSTVLKYLQNVLCVLSSGPFKFLFGLKGSITYVLALYLEMENRDEIHHFKIFPWVEIPQVLQFLCFGDFNVQLWDLLYSY
jgi:hypothetical protein